LLWAAVRGRKEVAELFLAKGADVNAQMDDGTTPLDWAKRRPETADLLRKHRAKTAKELKVEVKQLYLKGQNNNIYFIPS